MALEINSYSEVTVEPFIEVYEKFKTIKYVKIALKGKVIDATGKTMRVHQFGEACLQLVNENWIPDSVSDYIDLVINDFSGLMKIHYVNLKNMFDKIHFNSIGINGTIAVLQSIIIHKSMRNQGLGKLYMQLIIESLRKRYKANYLLLEAFPFEISKLNEEIFNSEQLLLEKMYTKLGFTKMNTKEVSTRYMYLNLNK